MSKEDKLALGFFIAGAVLILEGIVTILPMWGKSIAAVFVGVACLGIFAAIVKDQE